MANPDYQSIGALSPEAEATLTAQAGWDGLNTPVPEPESPLAAKQDLHFSRWNDRANRQHLANPDESDYAHDFLQNDRTADNIPAAGYGLPPFGDPPTAAATPTSFHQAPDGTIPGARTADEISGNQGTQN